jgi:hypothetical protein
VEAAADVVLVWLDAVEVCVRVGDWLVLALEVCDVLAVVVLFCFDMFEQEPPPPALLA